MMDSRISLVLGIITVGETLKGTYIFSKLLKWVVGSSILVLSNHRPGKNVGWVSIVLL